MLTVGELVMKKWRDDLHAWIESCDPTPWYQFPQVVLAETLSELGIWDAEVLEGQLQPGVNDDGTCGDDWLDVGGGACNMSDLMEDVEYGQTVRVIVLKEG